MEGSLTNPFKIASGDLLMIPLNSSHNTGPKIAPNTIKGSS